MAPDLEKKIEEQIYKLGMDGRNAKEAGNLDLAESKFLEAWSLLPEPKLHWDLCQIMSRSLVNFYRDAKYFDKAKCWLSVYKKTINAVDNPSFGILAGTVYFELGDLDVAFDYFMDPFMRFGKRPFEGLDDRYLNFTRERASKINNPN